MATPQPDGSEQHGTDGGNGGGNSAGESAGGNGGGLGALAATVEGMQTAFSTTYTTMLGSLEKSVSMMNAMNAMMEDFVARSVTVASFVRPDAPAAGTGVVVDVTIKSVNVFPVDPYTPSAFKNKKIYPKKSQDMPRYSRDQDSGVRGGRVQERPANIDLTVAFPKIKVFQSLIDKAEKLAEHHQGDVLEEKLLLLSRAHQRLKNNSVDPKRNFFTNFKNKYSKDEGKQKLSEFHDKIETLFNNHLEFLDAVVDDLDNDNDSKLSSNEDLNSQISEEYST